jgi:glutathione synthase/RimK-type ligase-like ATP-grasp enzyme
MKNPAQILVFYSFATHKTGYINRLFSELKKASSMHNLELYRGSLKDLHIQVTNNKLNVLESITGKKLNEFDAVYFELWQKSPQQALAAAKYLESEQIPYFSSELATFPALTKLGEYASLAEKNLPLIDSYFTSNKEVKKLAKIEQLPYNYPFILKDIEGYGGNNNFLVKNKDQLIEILEQNAQLSFVMQPFVENECDYRLLILDGKVELAIQRVRTTDSHLNNTSQGAEGKLVDANKLPENVLAEAIMATKLLKRQQFAGVDIMQDKKSGKYYILEVNQTPQIEEGAEVDAKVNAMLTYIRKRAEERGSK